MDIACYMMSIGVVCVGTICLVFPRALVLLPSPFIASSPIDLSCWTSCIHTGPELKITTSAIVSALRVLWCVSFPRTSCPIEQPRTVVGVSDATRTIITQFQAMHKTTTHDRPDRNTNDRSIPSAKSAQIATASERSIIQRII